MGEEELLRPPPPAPRWGEGGAGGEGGPLVQAEDVRVTDSSLHLSGGGASTFLWTRLSSLRGSLEGGCLGSLLGGQLCGEKSRSHLWWAPEQSQSGRGWGGIWSLRRESGRSRRWRGRGQGWGRAAGTPGDGRGLPAEGRGRPRGRLQVRCAAGIGLTRLNSPLGRPISRGWNVSPLVWWPSLLPQAGQENHLVI